MFQEYEDVEQPVLLAKPTGGSRSAIEDIVADVSDEAVVSWAAVQVVRAAVGGRQVSEFEWQW